jgi:hypothetical protein
MPPPNSNLGEAKRYQPYHLTKPPSNLQADDEVQEVLNNNTMPVTSPSGEQVLQLRGKLKCIPCFIGKKGAVLPGSKIFLTLVRR